MLLWNQCSIDWDSRVPLEITSQSLLRGSWHTAGICYSCELIEGRDCVWFISRSQGLLQEQAEGKCAYWVKNAGFANWLPLGLLDREGLELSFQDLFQSNHFKRPLSLNKQRVKAGFLGRRGVELKKSLFPFKTKLIRGDPIPPNCLSPKVMHIDIQEKANEEKKMKEMWQG